MKYLKTNCELEKKVQEVEALMEKHQLILFTKGSKLVLEFNNQEFLLFDIENNENSIQFPRFFDSEKFILEE